MLHCSVTFPFSIYVFSFHLLIVNSYSFTSSILIFLSDFMNSRKKHIQHFFLLLLFVGSISCCCSSREWKLASDPKQNHTYTPSLFSGAYSSLYDRPNTIVVVVVVQKSLASSQSVANDGVEKWRRSQSLDRRGTPEAAIPEH